MASKARWQVAWLPEALRGRATLLSCTALGTVATLLVATPSRAQPAANARPSLGAVAPGQGSATISSSANTTTIKQSSQRVSINWQSFDVGSQQTVDFIQPSSSSVALNRVISGNPSQIAGHIDANGQIILINQSGVIFYQGAQVNTAGLIVSAAGMSDVNFMAGKLVFDQAAHPNAAVVNQGSLTVQQAGLAALVAPQVANSGVITAQLGHVVLAGAKTATLDLYGDGLVSLDVTNQVTQAPVGPGGKPVAALVTNTGVIQADGGTVQLTAREADGLVQTLVQAGGRISADSVRSANGVGSKTGTVVLGGLGGSIVLSGVVTTDGAAPGSTGGQVQVDANHAVTLAAGSRISASGPAGGGTVAIGTTLARAAGGPGTVSTLTAQTTTIARGASVDADATANGDGGRVTVLSILSTSMAGNITALGGPQGGNGGFIETSGAWLGIGAGAVIDASALSATGRAGTWLLDPLNLDVVNGSTDTGVNAAAGPPFTITPTAAGAQISNGTIDGELNGGTNVVLTTVGSPTTGFGNITVDPGAAITWTSGATLTINAVNGIIIGAPITNTTNPAAALILNAGGDLGQNASNGAISVGNLAVTSVGPVTLVAANSVTTLAGSVSESGNSFQFNNTAAPLTVGTNVGGSGLSGITTNNGNISLTTTTSGAITLTGSLNAGAGSVALTSAGAITESGGAIIANLLTGSAAGAATLGNTGNAIANLGPFSSVESLTLNDTPTGATPTLTVVGTVQASAGLSTSALNLTVAGNLVIGPSTGSAAGLSGGAVDLVTTANGAATGTISETALGRITASTLTGSAAASVSLPRPNNQVNALAGFAAGSGFALSDDVPLTVTSAVNAGTGALSLASTGQIVVNANLSTSGGEIDLATGFGFFFTNTAAIASSGGNIVILADDMNLGGLGGTINAGSGVVVLGPAFPPLDVVLGAASNPGTSLGLQTADLATISAGMVQVGYAAENGAASFTGAISIGGTGGISVNPATIPALLLLTGGAVSQTEPLVFSAPGGTLGVIAGGNVILAGAGNAVDTVAGFAGNSSTFTLVNGQALTVGTMPAQQLGVAVDSTSGLASSAAMATGTGLPSNALTGVTTYGVTGGSPTPGAIVLETTAGNLALNAPVNASNGSTSLVAQPNFVGLQAFGNITQTSAGVISAAGVEALAGGSVTLDAAPNQIGNAGGNGMPGLVAGTAGTGSFALLDSGQVLETNILAVSAGVTLTIATGVVTSNADINLASAGLVLNQPLDAGSGTVRLVESGAVSQASTGIITAGSLSVTDNAGQVVLEGLNAVGTVAASLTSGGSTFTFNDAGTLLTLGSVAAAPPAEDPTSAFGVVTGVATNGGDINLLSSGLAVNAAVGAGSGTVRLLEFGAVTQAPGSPITAGALAVTDSGGQVVLETANAIGTLAVNETFAGGALSFSNGTTAVTVGSIVAAGLGADPGGTFGAVTGLTTSNADINLASGGLTLSNAVDAGGGTVRLLESGAVSQAAGGVITAGSLGVTDSGGQVVLEAANAVGMVAANVTFGGGAFSFNDPATALIIGSVAGAPGAEDPAMLFAATVTGAATRNGDINLASAGLALNEAVGAGSGTVRLVDSGRLSQLVAGGIAAGSLAVTLSDGSAGLGATNAVGTVAANLTFLGGAFSLNDGTAALTVGSVAAAPGGPGSEDPSGLFAAVVGVTTNAGNVTLQAAGMTLNQAVSAGTANVTLTSAGSISQGASGAITAADLDAVTELDAGGSISLTGPGNKVGKATLTSLNGAGNALSSGAIAFADGTPLTIANLSLLQTGVATIGAVQLATGGASLTVETGAAVSGSSVEIGVSAAGGLFTNDGAVSAITSGATPVGDVVILADRMSLAGGTISAPDAVVLGPFTTNVGITLGGGAGGTLSLAQGDLATISAGLLQIGYSSLTGDISIAGALSLSAPQVPALALVTGGSVSETGGGAVTFAGTGSLAVVAGGPVSMPDNNEVSTLAGSTSGSAQGFAFTNADLALTVGAFPLALLGVVPDGNNFPVPSTGTAPSGVATTNGNITLATVTADDLALDAPVNAGSGTVALNSAGAITQTAGGIVTGGTLTTSSTGGTTLGEANEFAALGTSTDTSTTGITLVDGEPLTVVGTVTAAANATLTLTTTTGALAIGAAGTPGVLSAGTVALTAAGAISEPRGSIVAGTLTVATTGAGGVTLASPTNQIGTDAGISVNSGNLVLVDDASLTLTGRQSANNLFFEVNAAGGALDLGASAALTGSGGGRISLVADRMSATAGASMSGAGTVELAPFSAATTLTLGATGAGLSVTPTLLGSISIGQGGTLVIGRVTPVLGFGTVEADGITIGASVTLGSSAAGTLDLESTGGVSEAAAVALSVGTLISSGGITGGAVTLAGTGNAIGTLGGFAVTGNPFSLSDTGALSVNGAVTASGVTIGGAAGSTPTGITLTGTGSIAAPAITLAAGNAGIALNTGASLGQAGATVDLSSAGGINEVAGATITAATLQSSGGVSGAAELNGTANAIASLGAFSTTAGLALTDNAALTVNGPVSDSGIGQTVALTTTTGGITLNGAINAANDTLDLVSAGAINQSGGSINVATLTGSATGSASLTAATNLVGTLRAFSTGNGFALTDNKALLVDGPVADSGTGQTVALTTGVGGIMLAGVISAPNDTLDLVSAGAISQTGGSIDVATLTGSAAGDVSLTGPNAITALGVLGAPFNNGFQAFSLTDVDALTVNGVTASTVTLTAPSLTIPGAITGNELVSLTATTGGISETGSVSADLLTGSAATSAALTGTNTVASLGDFTATAGFALTDTTALSVAGVVNGGSNVTLTDTLGLTINGSVTGTTVGLSGFAININGAVDGPTSVTLTSPAGVVSEGGSITTALLTGSVGDAELDGTNSITGLGDFTTTAGFSLNDIPALSVTGTVNGGPNSVAIFDTGALAIVGSVTAASASLSGASLTISGAVSGPASVMLTATTGGISETGSLSTGNLTVSAAGSVALTGTNAIAFLDGPASTATTDFSLTDTSALSVLSAVNGGSNLTLTAAGALAIGGSVAATTIALTGTSINISGAVNGPTSVTLTATAGGISETPNGSTAVVGSVSTALLSGSATTNVALTGTGNLVGMLGAFGTGAGFALVDNEALTVAGLVTDAGSGQTVALTTEVGGIGLVGRIIAPNDTLKLISASSINQGSGGQIEVATLTGSAATSVSLTQAGNQVGTLGAFTTTAGFALTDDEALTVNGAVSDFGNGQTVAITTTAGGITLGSGINASNDTLDLVAAGNITEPGGPISAQTLTGSATGTVSLTRATNLVFTLGAFSTDGGFTLMDSPTLRVVGPVNDIGNGAAVTLTTGGGDLILAGAVNAAHDTLNLVSAGAIAQTGGSIDVAGLTGSAASSASLTQATNVVGTLGAFTTTAGFALVDSAALRVTGPLTDTGVGQTVSLTTTSGGITLAGNINATNDTIDLVSAGSITQTGGVIDPVTLTGSAVGSVSLLEPGNLIGTLATFTAGTSFELADSEGLTLTGVLTAPLIFINMPGNPLTLAAGAALITGGTPAPNQATITAGQLPPIPPPGNGVGAYFKSGTFTQLGTDSVTPIGGANSILYLDVTNGQNVSLAGLTAPTTWLILGLAAPGSKVTGNAELGSLTVSLPPGSVPSDFSVILTGSIGGVSGQEAAGKSGVIPTKGASLQFNDCPIGTVGCVVLPGVPVPTGSPLQYLTLGFLVAPGDEGDLLLPLVSDEDYLSCLLRKDCN